MKRRKILLLLILPLLFICLLNPVKVSAEENQIFLGGFPAGFSIYTKGANVVGLCDVVSVDKVCSPAKESGILVGDTILQIDNSDVNNAQDVEKAIKDGKTKILTIKRQGEIILKEITPSKDSTGKHKLGLFIKDAVNGIGTITYLTSSEIGCLWHPVLNDDLNLLEITGGKIYDCSVNGVIKGVKGRPGELRGVYAGKDQIADITQNSMKGVFGKVKNNYSFPTLTPIDVGVAEMGDAYIYTTILGETPKKYSISIVKCEYDKEDRNFVIKINDKSLLEQTGGIVQGMSGSPIVQNNKLVGAVTHVFVNDPTRGFGIAIDKMLNH